MSNVSKVKYPCPVCGQHFFEEDGDYELCPICSWWNDGVQRDDPDYEGGANDMSVNQYREAWLKGLPRS